MQTARLWLLIVVSVGSLGATCGPTLPSPAPRSAAAERVHALYEAWKRDRAQSGHEILVPLGFAKGITASEYQIAGLARFDPRSLEAPSLRVEVRGLVSPAEVWLVDNRPARGSSTLPDESDEFVFGGPLSAVPSGASATVSLEAWADADTPFELDRIIVTPAGAGPHGQPLLVGAPGTFERLRARELAGTLSADAVAAEIERLVARGRQLFEAETFGGNGRTCATCHPALNNFTIDPGFIATLSDDDPLFVAENVPALAALENPALLRARGVILENLDGFDRPIVPPAQRTGWSGDGAPGSGSLREFAIGAVIQHFPRTLERVTGRDFRLPTDEELDALELFQLSLGRQEELEELGFTSPLVRAGKAIFDRLDTAEGTLPAGKCALCHSRAGANIDSAFFSELLGAPVSGNANFGTGINELGALPSELIDADGAPRDGGFARIPHDGNNCVPPTGGFGTVTPEGGALPPGLCEEDFNTPPLVEAADTAPFFHSNAVDSLEAAVGFYNDDAFNDSAGGRLLASLDSGGVGIRLDASEVSAVAAFLRAVNALENIRVALELLDESRRGCRSRAKRALERALAEQRDAVEVLAATGLHPEAVAALSESIAATKRARRALFCHSRERRLESAARALVEAREAIALRRAAS
jgi:mono/diheme cytochrome c family protein